MRATTRGRVGMYLSACREVRGPTPRLGRGISSTRSGTKTAWDLLSGQYAHRCSVGSTFYCGLYVHSAGDPPRRDYSRPFVDFNAELANATTEQKDLLVGRNSRLLLDAGLVSWSELLGRYEVIPLEYVIYRKGLELKAVLAAGVPEEDARMAWARVSEFRSRNNPPRIALELKFD